MFGGHVQFNGCKTFYKVVFFSYSSGSYLGFNFGEKKKKKKKKKKKTGNMTNFGVTDFLSVAWPTGVQLVFFFCSGVSRLFGAQGSPSSGSLLNL